MSAGAWTSSAMPSPTAAAFGCWLSSTTSPANACAWSQTHPCQAQGLPASWTASSPSGGSRGQLSRQRHANDQHGHSQMVPRDPSRITLHRPRQDDAKWLRRKFQRQFPGRVPQRNPVLVAHSGPRRHHRMEGGLQPKQTALIAGQHHSQRVRYENGYGEKGRIRPD